ncbi:Kynurenine-oxoglutarate transaminase, partial [Globisporangium splendens]
MLARAAMATTPLRLRGANAAAATATACRSISTRVAAIGNNVFAEISLLAAQHGAVNLGQGFPSFHTPEFVKQAAIDAINGNHNQYTRPGGQVDYVNVLAEMYSPLLKRELNPMKEIVTFNGAQEGIASIMAALLEPGDEVVTFEPYFDAYKTVSTLLGIKTVGIPFELSPEKQQEFSRRSTNATFSSGDFRIDLDKLDKIITKNTKMIVLNTPHNPTGKVFSKHELEQIAEVLKKHPHVLILSDEVYEFMAYDGLQHERIASFPGLFDRTISLFSAGKTFSCTGWRVGYAIAPEHLTSAITKAHSTVPFCGTTPLEVAMASCFKQVQTNGYLDELKATLEAKRDRLVGALTEANWRPIVPEGGYFVCCNVTHLPVFQEFTDIKITPELPKPLTNLLLVVLWVCQQYPDYQFAYKLCKDYKLAVIPTSPFFTRPEHQLAPGVVRLAFCKDDETLDAAIRVISSFKS